MAKTTRKNHGTSATVGYEAELWAYGKPSVGNAHFAWVQRQ